MTSGVTKLMRRRIHERVKDLTEVLVTSAGHNPVLDSYNSGIISALRDVLENNFLDED